MRTGWIRILQATWVGLMMVQGSLTPQSLNVRNYDSRVGLSSSETYGAIQDSRGNIWIASDGGVTRYDGREFKRFTTANGLVDNTVFNIYEDWKGRIWFFSYSGAVCYLLEEKFHSIRANDSLKNMIGYRNEVNVSYFVDSADTLWISYNSRPYCVKIPPTENYSTPLKITDNRHERHLIMRNANHLLYTSRPPFTRNGVLHITGTSGDTASIPVIEGNSYASADYVRLHSIGTDSALLSIAEVVYFIANGSIKNVSRYPARVIALNTDAKKRAWVGVYRNGVYRYDNCMLQGHPEKLFDGLSVTGVLHDHELGLWFTTLEKGLFYSASDMVRHVNFGPDESLITTLSAIGDTLFAGNAAGKVFTIDQRTDKQFRAKFLLKSPTEYRIDFIEKVHSGFLVNSSSLGRFSASGKLDYIFRYQHYTFPSVGIIKTDTDSILCASLYELHLFSSRGRQVRKVASFPVRITRLHKHNGEIFVGCRDGLWKLVNNHPRYLGHEFPGLSFPITDILTSAGGDLIVGTNGNGVFTLSEGSCRLLPGLTPAMNFCTALAEDDRGRIWVGTNEGLFRYDLAQGKSTFYRASNGLRANEITRLSYFRNHLFVATPLGVDYFPVDAVFGNPTPPLVAIQYVVVNDTVLNPGEPEQNFRYNQNNLEFGFIGYTFKQEGAAKFRYMLKGYEDEWHTTSNSSVRYANLPARQYTFMVSAINNDNVITIQPATFSFTIAPPWWQLPVFIITASVAGAGTLTALILLIVRQSREKHRRKARIEQVLIESKLTALRAQMNPHFIFNVINSIQHFILLNNKEQAYDYLARFSRLIRMVLDNSRDTTVTLDQEVRLLTLYAELEKLRFENKFDFKLEVRTESPGDSLYLPNMLIQPYVENAIIHGLAPSKRRGVIEVRFVQEDNVLHATVTDNGVGREFVRNLRKKHKHKSVGMAITSERVKAISEFAKSEITITVTDLKTEAGEPAGTRVDLSIPIQRHEVHNR